MALVSDLITESFIDLGVIAPGETITTAMQTNAFLVLQQMMAGLSVEQAMNYVVYHQIFTLVAGTSAYTVGTGGTLVATANPNRITGWQSISNNFRNGGQIISFEEFHATIKDPFGSRSIIAQAVAADQLYPSINILVWPTPDTSPASLQLDYYASLPAYSTVGDTVTLPDGWQAMLHFNLAIALAPQYARQGGVPDALAANAQNSKALIVQKNAAIIGLTQAPQQAA